MSGIDGIKNKQVPKFEGNSALQPNLSHYPAEPKHLNIMRSFSTLLSLTIVSAAAVLTVGCAGPSQKLGRGIANITEPIRMGELNRTKEQTYLSSGPDVAYTRGLVYGLGKTIARTAVGAYEIVTFPIPDHGSDGYGPILFPANPVYPDSYTPKIVTSSIYQVDANLGFGGGDVAPWFPGSKFNIFD